jgi:lysophospholipase L1-like esterase
MKTHHHTLGFRPFVFAFIILTLLGCSPADQEVIGTEMAKAGKTVVSAAQTQVVESGKTAVAEGKDMVGTEAAHIKETAIAKAATIFPGGEKKAVVDYFALGDSLASGYGLMDTGTACHRSDLSYPFKVRNYLLKRYQVVNFKHLACKGATAGQPSDQDLQKDVNKWFRNQVDWVVDNLSDRPTLVTITIGANDIGWTNYNVLKDHMMLFGDEYLGWVQTVKDNITKELLVQIPRLFANHPNVAVLITTIPNPFNEKSVYFPLWGRLCTDILSTLDCYQRTEYMISGINTVFMLDVIIPIGRPANVRVVPVDVKFAKHASPRPSCGSAGTDVSDTWVQYPNDPNSNGDVPSDIKLIFTHAEHGDCFHPNEKGAQAFADLVNEYALKLGK